MQLQSRHFTPTPWPWAKVRPYVRQQISGGKGGQGVVLELGPELEGAVLKLYETPRPSNDLSRVQALIKMCEKLSPEQPATAEWFKRLNLPLRPVLSRDNRFGGVVLPPLPKEVNAREYQYDNGRFVPLPTQVTFEAQFITKRESPLGQTTEKWQWRLLSSLAETVALMHTVNLVHGDLSLTNVLATQANDSHLDDNVYLIDIDDAFLDDGIEKGAPAIRKSRSAYDPYSIQAGWVSKETDVFVVALWAVAFMEYRFHPPEALAHGLPTIATGRLRLAHASLPEVVAASLGPIGARPTMVELYMAIRKGAKEMGALR